MNNLSEMTNSMALFCFYRVKKYNKKVDYIQNFSAAMGEGARKGIYYSYGCDNDEESVNNGELF